MTFLNQNNPAIRVGDGPHIDAFDRLRVSNPTTLFDSKQLYDKNEMVWSEETSGGTETSLHDTEDAAVTMAVNANAEYVIRQTKMRFGYQPGKSQLMFMTAVFGTQTSNVTKRVGYFNSGTGAPYTATIDGIYLEDDGTDFNWVISKNGTPTSVAQSSWNIDTMDGNGPSGVTLDFTKAQIMVIDFEWLGVGRVRVGFVIDGIVIYCHEFLHANSVTSVYMSSPNHSVRYEIRSTGGSSNLTHICSSVISEGGIDPLGVYRCDTTGGTHVTATTENIVYALLGIRLKTTHLDAIVHLAGERIQLQSASDRVLWSLIMNPTVAGTWDATYSDESNSCVQIATGASANTVTGGTVLAAGFAESAASQGGGAGSTAALIKNALRIGAALDGTRDEVVLCVQPIGGTSAVEVEAVLEWREGV